MKNIAKRGRILGALALTVSMCLSFCPTNAFADDDSSPRNYYHSDYDNYTDVLANGDKIEQQVYAEGIVMLKNEDNALPIPEGSNISVFLHLTSNRHGIVRIGLRKHRKEAHNHQNPVAPFLW